MQCFKVEAGEVAELMHCFDLCLQQGGIRANALFDLCLQQGGSRANSVLTCGCNWEALELMECFDLL